MKMSRNFWSGCHFCLFCKFKYWRNSLRLRDLEAFATKSFRKKLQHGGWHIGQLVSIFSLIFGFYETSGCFVYWIALHISMQDWWWQKSDTLQYTLLIFCIMLGNLVLFSYGYETQVNFPKDECNKNLFGFQKCWQMTIQIVCWKVNKIFFNMATCNQNRILVCLCIFITANLTFVRSDSTKKRDVYNYNNKLEQEAFKALFSADGYFSDTRQEPVDPKILGGIRIQIEALKLWSQLRQTANVELGIPQMQVGYMFLKKSLEIL